MQKFELGDKVIKNPDTWIPSEFDTWSAGEGIGIVVDLLVGDEECESIVDIRWNAGRSFHQKIELINYTQLLRIKKIERIIEK